MYKMKIIVANNIRVINPDEKIKDYVETNLVIKNPQYEQLKRLGKWTGNTPMHLVWYVINGNELILPFGCLKDLFNMYPKEVFENHIILGEKLKYQSNIELYNYQEKACQAVVNAKNGIMVLPAGSGKTQVALEIIARLGYKALWLSHTLDLINQSYNRAKDNFTNIGLGKIVSGKIEIGTHITFATVQTLSKIDLQEYADEFDVVVVDECHRVCRHTIFCRYVLQSNR